MLAQSRLRTVCSRQQQWWRSCHPACGRPVVIACACSAEAGLGAADTASVACCGLAATRGVCSRRMTAQWSRFPGFWHAASADRGHLANSGKALAPASQALLAHCAGATAARSPVIVPEHAPEPAAYVGHVGDDVTTEVHGWGRRPPEVAEAVDSNPTGMQITFLGTGASVLTPGRRACSPCSASRCFAPAILRGQNRHRHCSSHSELLSLSRPSKT